MAPFKAPRVFVLAFLLLVLSGAAALAQPPAGGADEQANAAIAGTSVAFIFGCVCIFALVILAINIAILVWVYKDAQARGADPMLWLILTFFTGLIGLIMWLIVRPPLQQPPMQ